jgi:RNA polymerase sigma factor (sigma-70 family)
LLKKWGIRRQKLYIRSRAHKERLAEEAMNVRWVDGEEGDHFRHTRLHPLRSLAERFLAHRLDRGPQPVVVLERDAALAGVRPIAELHRVKDAWGVVEFLIGDRTYWAYPETPIGDLNEIAKGQIVALLPWTRREMFRPWGNNSHALWPVLGGGKAHGTAEDAAEAEAQAYPGRSADSPCQFCCPNCPDEDLIRHHLNPDLRDEDRRCALDQLFSRYWPAAFLLAQQVLHNKDGAQEATQEAFYKAQKGLPAFRGDSSFKTWLLRIVRNAAYDRVRRGEVRKTQRISATLNGSGDWAVAYAEGGVLPGEFPSDLYDPQFPHARPRQWPAVEDVDEFKTKHKRPRSTPRIRR